MNHAVRKHLDALTQRCPELGTVAGDIALAYSTLADCFRQERTLFVAGNGGSCSDAEHIVGELQKGFLKKRPIPPDHAQRLQHIDPPNGELLAAKLQQGLPAISLNAHTALMTAVANDTGGEFAAAQALYAMAREHDVLLAISTSGNAHNVCLACDVACLMNMQVVGMTGEAGGRLASLCNVCIRVPAIDTFRVQEYHLPIYHTLCAMLEEAFFQ